MEHRTPKARYPQTSHKLFVKQLADIEHREARIRHIKARLPGAKLLQEERVSKSPEEHHHIGLSQNAYEHIGTFLCCGAGDPAIKV